MFDQCRIFQNRRIRGRSYLQLGISCLGLVFIACGYWLGLVYLRLKFVCYCSTYGSLPVRKLDLCLAYGSSTVSKKDRPYVKDLNWSKNQESHINPCLRYLREVSRYTFHLYHDTCAQVWCLFSYGRSTIRLVRLHTAALFWANLIL